MILGMICGGIVKAAGNAKHCMPQPLDLNAVNSH